MPVKPANDLSRVLVLCRDMEATMAELYFFLAAHHKDYGPVAALWLKTAREEQNHARQFEMAASHEEAIGELDLSVDDARALFESVSMEYNRLQKEQPEVIDALKTTVHLEECLVDFHVARMAQFHESATKKLFAAMLAADRDHIGALKRKLAEFTERLDERRE